MSQAAAEKFNKRVSYVPRASFGKPNRKDGSENFVTARGARFTATKIIMLGLISTEDIMYGSLHKTPYSSFMTELNFARGTVGRNLKELIDDGITERRGQSKYEIIVDYSKKKNVPVYHFLLDEPLNLGHKAKVKKLSPNAVLCLCEMIRFYLMSNEERGYQKWFIGGNKRVSSTLNAPKGTAAGIIKELEDTQAIYIKQLHKDIKGNEWVTPGKGKSGKTQTVYEVNSEILRRCSAIQKELADRKEAKKLQKKVAAIAGKGAKEYTEQYHKYVLAETNEYKFKTIEAAFANDNIYQNLKRQYADIRDNWLKVLKLGEYIAADELEVEMDNALQDVENYLLRSGIPPGGMPEDLASHIIKAVA